MALNDELKKIFFNYSDRRYWFVRTEGGSFYDDFVKYGFIAIDNDGVGYREILNATKSQTKKNPAQKIIAEAIKKRKPEATFHLVHAKALMDFCFAIKKNDIVFIPDDFNALSFGIVQDTVVDLEYKRNDEVPFTFRRKVRWIEKRRRKQLDAEVWPLFNTQKTINDASKYSDFLNPALSSLFKTGDLSHLSLDVLTDKPIDGRLLFTLGNDIIDLSNDLSKYFEEDIQTNKMDVKIELRSPGTIELISYSMLALGALGVILIGLSGGKWKFNMKNSKFEFSGDMETDGFIEKANKFMNDGTERQMKLVQMQEKLRQLEISDTRGDIREILVMEETKSLPIATEQNDSNKTQVPKKKVKKISKKNK